MRNETPPQPNRQHCGTRTKLIAPDFIVQEVNIIVPVKKSPITIFRNYKTLLPPKHQVTEPMCTNADFESIKDTAEGSVVGHFVKDQTEKGLYFLSDHPTR